MVDFLALLAVNGLLLVLAYYVVLQPYGNRPKARKGYQEVEGLPFLGNIIALGRGGAAYLSECRRKVCWVYSHP